MINNVYIDGKEMTVIVLGEKGWVDVNEYRKAIFNMFEMASLFKDFEQCLDKGQMWTILKFIEALGIPENKEKGGGV